MKLTNYFYKHQVNDNMYYILNTLAGSLDLLTNDENYIVEKWINEPEIVPTNSNETELFESLKHRKYILSSDEENKLKIKVDNNAEKLYKNICNLDKVIVIMPSYNCNFNCPYCFEEGNNTSVKIMTKEMVDKIFEDNNNDIKNITFYGGEPFLPAHKEIIQYIVSKAPNAKYSALTNGYYLKEFYDILKDLDILNLQVTFDGSRENHNKTRIRKDGSSTFDRIMEGVDYYLQNGIPIKIRMNISNENIEDCLRLRKDLSLKYLNKKIYFELQPIFQNTEEDTNRLSEAIYKSDIEGLEIMDDNRKKYNTIVFSEKSILNFLKTTDSGLNPVYNNCNAETLNRFYDAEGDIYSCTLAVGNKAARVGEYYPKSKLFKNNMLERNIHKIPKCSKCKFAYICGGGCGYAVLPSDGNSLVPNCGKLRNMLSVSIPQAIERKLQYLGLDV